MKILNAYLGQQAVKKIYRGQDLIYKKATDKYIKSTIGESGGTPGYIPVLDKELYSNYKYEVDCELNRCQPRIWCFAGGTYSSGSGLYFGIYMLSGDPAAGDGRGMGLFDHGSILTSGNKIAPSQEYTVQERGVYTFYNPEYTPYSPISGDTYRRTDGGFFLMHVRDYSTGDPVVGEYLYPDGLYGVHGKVYRITIYDSDGTTVLMNFLPTTIGGHIGMIDTISGTFYPCSDDTKFEIGQEE